MISSMKVNATTKNELNSGVNFNRAIRKKKGKNTMAVGEEISIRDTKTGSDNNSPVFFTEQCNTYNINLVKSKSSQVRTINHSPKRI